LKVTLGTGWNYRAVDGAPLIDKTGCAGDIQQYNMWRENKGIRIVSKRGRLEIHSIL
jgi:hypothetical protein